MRNETIQIPVETVLIPTFYENFQCLMGNCRDNCCGGWIIGFDKKDYLRLRRMDAPPAFRSRLGDTIRRVRNMDPFYAVFQLDAAGNCPLQDADGLCSLQKKCGERALPLVCSSFPRRNIVTPAGKEYSLSPGCEGVLELLWNMPDGVEFIEKPMGNESGMLIIDPAKTPFTPWFETIRSLSIDILQNRALSLSHRMLLLGLACSNLTAETPTAKHMEQWYETFESLTHGDAAENLLKSLKPNLRMYLAQNAMTVARMQETFPWAGELLNRIGASIRSNNGMGLNEKRFLSQREDMEESLGTLECFFENLMVAVVMWQTFPDPATADTIWKSYINLCNVFSFFRFISVACFDPERPKETLFHYLVLASRALLHSRGRQAIMQEEFFMTNSVSLAHMAILVGE